jgi:hypothetical protein
MKQYGAPEIGALFIQLSADILCIHVLQIRQ